MSDKWYSLSPDFPLFEMNENKEVRRKGSIRKAIIRYYDEDGNLLDENVVVSKKEPRNLVQDGKNVILRKNGHIVAKSRNRLYQKYVLKEDTTPKNKRHRRKRKIQF
ncbi:hypothetical protein [Flagellimonas onchidii]|uniref:hypothetical protein n=1 Tax=Flagellimonas onchidii TaxID=2562684 RepID=UPI0010A6748F|nr:hypothetical protein [Allomuricauda onchidii]